MANPLYDTLLAPHAGRGDAFLHLPGGGTLSYAEFLATAARFAHALAAQGVQPGDRVAAQVAKSPEALALAAACLQAGFVYLPLNTGYTGAEVAYFLENSGAAAIVCDSAREAEITAIARCTGAACLTLGADGAGSLAEGAAAHTDSFPTAPRAPDDLAALLYTSGTTGRPKGAMLTHTNLVSNALVLRDVWRFTADDVLLHALPIFHTHGLFVATNVILAAGAAMIFLPGFDTDAVIDRLPETTTMMGVPTFYTRLLDSPRFTAETARHMRLFVSGSAPLRPATHAAFEARTGHRILERYGLTETGMNTSNPYEGERRPGTVGPPLAGVALKITDPETGAELPQGATGQIEVRGDNVFQGYWAMPEKTAEALRVDGFFRTGDLGRRDADGYVEIVGRAKDLIISGGMNIYPREVEAVIDAQPGVAESAVIGVPHPDLGEAAVAVIVPEPGPTPDAQALEAAVADHLARYKHPRRYITAEALPRNTMGKVQKATLRETHARLFGMGP